ncbi:MAG: histidine kinase [Clostridia bacterium]|nr:histidine kinase [Clostridia bacterium]
MNSASVFNVTICIIGILILSIHIANILIKRKHRADEKNLLVFFIFTAVHFVIYLIFTFIKTTYSSNALVIAFYTAFYIMNNLEVFLLFRYFKSYKEVPHKTQKVLEAINISLFVVFVLLDVINIFTGIFFTASNGIYLRSKTMMLSQGYQFVMLCAIFVATFVNKNLNKREKLAFASYCILPFFAIILQNIFKGYAIAYASIVIAIEILFAFLSVERNLELSRQQEKNKEAQIKIMLSQIKPHFVYNSLSSISTLITIDPQKAQRALDDFTEYLRRNLSSLTETRLISFEDELKHIKTYISLEKMRFGDRINIVYDIQKTDFNVPPLSIQPIVENAIKHGILQKISGGTLTIKTYKNDNKFFVEVIDDGVGFDASRISAEQNNHFGINNIKYRIENMCKGDITIKSEVGKGTQVVVVFPN